MTSAQGTEVTGYWQPEELLSRELIEHDRPYLETFMNGLPDEVTPKRIEVVVEGRVWSYRPIEYVASTGEVVRRG